MKQTKAEAVTALVSLSVKWGTAPKTPSTVWSCWCLECGEHVWPTGREPEPIQASGVEGQETRNLRGEVGGQGCLD